MISYFCNKLVFNNSNSINNSNHLLMKNRLIALLTMIIVQMPFMGLFAQETFDVTEDLTFDFSKAKVEVSDNAKRLRALKRLGGGVIILKNVENTPVSDEITSSLKVAKDVWSDYMAYGDTLRLDLYFDPNLSADMRISIPYQLDGSQKYIYPPTLGKHLHFGLFPSSYDAKIYINTSVEWNFGVGEENAYKEKNLTLAFMQCICRCLGFGSSLITKRGVEFEKRKYASIFDHYIINEKGSRLEDFVSDRSGLQQFATGKLGNVYFSSNSVSAKLYAPTVFDQNASFKYTDGEMCLMDINSKNIGENLVIDDLTLDVLNELGWNFNHSSQYYSIVSDDVDSTGIASAYSLHSFYISPTPTNVAKQKWNLILTAADGSSEIYCSSNGLTFTIPQISNTDKYQHSIDGDICGVISFEGVVDGKNVDLSYPIRLELKPRILSAKILNTTTNPDNPNYYDAIVEIKYEGAHYVHAYVEEDYSPLLKYYYSSTPYYTKMNLTNIASWCDAWFDITIRNEYGSDNCVVDLTFGDGAEIAESKLNKALSVDDNNNVGGNIGVYAYDIHGNCLGAYSKCKGNLPKGLYLLKYFNNDNNCIKVVKICIN